MTAVMNPAEIAELLPYMTADERAELDALISVPSRTRSFYEFVAERNPSLLQYEHVPRLIDVAQRVVDGHLRRVIIMLAPRYFKSEIFSRLLPAYFLEQHPTKKAGLASYGAELAWELSEEAKNNFAEAGGLIRRETNAKKRWRTEQGGEMWAAGAGGPLLGRGWHLGIVDDPSDPEKAHSPTYQRRFINWWPSKFMSRQEPGGAVIFIAQRLGTLDPFDFLFRREVGEDTDLAPEHWHVVVCDEIKSDLPLGRWDGPQGLPKTCTIEPDPRRVGEVLAPTRFTKEQVKAMQRTAGTYVTAAQRQQRPAAPEGDFWQKSWFVNVFDELPAGAYNGGKDWDTAYTKEEANSASAWIETFRGPGAREEFPIYVNDLDWEWLEFPELVQRMKSKPGPHYIEQKASGKSAAQSLRREKITVSEVAVAGDKFTRATGAQPVVSAGRIHVRRSVLRKLLEGERQGLLRVTAEQLLAGGPDLDLNDVFVQAINRHVGKRQGRSAPPPPSRSHINL